MTFLWVIFRADDAGQAFLYIKTMLGIEGAGLNSAKSLIYIREYFVYLVAAIILSTNVLPVLQDKFISKADNIRNGRIRVYILNDLCAAALFFVSVVYVINGTYNPFIYFNF